VVEALCFRVVRSCACASVRWKRYFINRVGNLKVTNKAFIDIRLRPGIATPLHASPYRPLRPKMTLSINRKYITYRNAANGGPSHGHSGSAHKISWESVQRFQKYARGQTDTQIHRHADRQTDRNTPLPYRSKVITNLQFTNLELDRNADTDRRHQTHYQSQSRRQQLSMLATLMIKSSISLLGSAKVMGTDGICKYLPL